MLLREYVQGFQQRIIHHEYAFEEVWKWTVQGRHRNEKFGFKESPKWTPKCELSWRSSLSYAPFLLISFLQTEDQKQEDAKKRLNSWKVIWELVMEDLHHRAAVNLSFSFRTPSISCLLPSFQEQLLTVETRTHERNHNIWTTTSQGFTIWKRPIEKQSSELQSKILENRF